MTRQAAVPLPNANFPADGLRAEKLRDFRGGRALRPRSQPILELANLEIPGDITHQAHSRSTTPVGTRRARRDVLIRSSSGERGTSL